MIRRLTLAATAVTAFAVGCASPAPGGVSPVRVNSAVETTATTDTTMPPDTAALSLQGQVDLAVASDGVPFAYDRRLYLDAYSAILAECNAWTNLHTNVTAVLQQRVAGGYIQPGEQAALRVGVPLACPQYADQVTAALG